MRVSNTVGGKPAAAQEQLPEFLPGDIILCPPRSSDPIGQILASMQRAFGEGPTYATHTAQFLDSRTILEMDIVAQVKTLAEFLKGRTAFEVWRCLWLSAEQREAITRKAGDYRHRKFGIPNLVTHLLDGLINKVSRKEVFFFRRLNHNDRYPICSWITAFTYDRAAHYQFGVPPECAEPDQICDWVKTHPAEWQQVFCMEEYLRNRAIPVSPGKLRHVHAGAHR